MQSSAVENPLELRYCTICRHTYDNYNKIDLCRKCEVIIYILDKFSDDITIRFASADKDVKNDAKIYYGYNLGDRLLAVFNVIMKVMEVESYNPTQGLKKGESIEDEVSHLKKEFTTLVDKYNKKYHERLEKNKLTGECPTCDCECCCGCGCGC